MCLYVMSTLLEEYLSFETENEIDIGNTLRLRAIYSLDSAGGCEFQVVSCARKRHRFQVLSFIQEKYLY